MVGMVDQILDVFRTRGAEPYGEDVSVADHCLQCAALAAREGAADPLILAALLHDVGHLVAAPDDGFGVHRHDIVGAAYLADRFPISVVDPVRLHVEAKRYRVALDPDYRARLSAASTHTLAHQGGPMSPREMRAFEANPHHRAAIRLRAWDDAGKVEGLDVPPLDTYRNLLSDFAV